MSEKEVKTGWNFSYISLILVIAIVSSLGTILVTYIFREETDRVITVKEESSGNLLFLSPELRDQVSTRFELTQQPTIDLKSFFRYRVTFRNAGDMGVESLGIVIEALDASAVLLKPPTISTEPSNLISAISIKTNGTNQAPNKDEWQIPLLNKGETVVFDYAIYSEKLIEEIKLRCVSRKKDWDCIKISSDQPSKNDWVHSDWLPFVAGTIAFIFLTLAEFLRSGIRNVVEKIVRTMYR